MSTHFGLSKNSMYEGKPDKNIATTTVFHDFYPKDTCHKKSRQTFLLIEKRFYRMGADNPLTISGLTVCTPLFILFIFFFSSYLLFSEL